MRNARRYDNRITIGSVPSSEDLVQLRELGYKTLVDLRDDEEKFGGLVQRRAAELGLRYVSVPVRRDNVDVADVESFYRTVYGKGSAPVYAFSRFGKKPLAFLLLFEAVARGEPYVRVFQRASRFGLNLEGDLALKKFLVEFINARKVEPIVEIVRQLRPDLIRTYDAPEAQAEEPRRALGPRHEQGLTVLFTGLPAAGKSTVARLLVARLHEIGGRPVTFLDGEVVRRNLSSELSFSKKHRDLNIRRIGFVAAEITKNGGIAVCAPIAPYDAARRELRRMISEAGGFVLVHVATPLAECEARDPKGMYAKARSGQIRDFTGVSDPYEVPLDAELVLDTTNQPPETSAQQVLGYLERMGYLVRSGSPG